MTTIICTGRRIYSYRAGSIEMASNTETIRFDRRIGYRLGLMHKKYQTMLK